VAHITSWDDWNFNRIYQVPSLNCVACGKDLVHEIRFITLAVAQQHKGRGDFTASDSTHKFSVCMDCVQQIPLSEIYARYWAKIAAEEPNLDSGVYKALSSVCAMPMGKRRP